MSNKKADLHQVMKTQGLYLTMTKRYELLKLLKRLEELFDCTFGTWKTD